MQEKLVSFSQVRLPSHGSAWPKQKRDFGRKFGGQFASCLDQEGHQAVRMVIATFSLVMFVVSSQGTRDLKLSTANHCNTCLTGCGLTFVFVSP